MKKKEIHLECNSNLECTYSYNFSDNTIEQRLEEIMDKNSIKLNPLSNEEIEKLLANLEIDKFNTFFTRNDKTCTRLLILQRI